MTAPEIKPKYTAEVNVTGGREGRAVSSDGVLDVLIASPSNQLELTQMVSAVLAQSKEPSTMDRRTGRRVHIQLRDEELYELDGDVIGKTTELVFTVLPSALKLRVPR